MSEIDPRITIIKDDTVSIDDLAAAQRSGISVLRSAHVGNLSPYNLALAAEFPLLLVDHNQTGVDRTYQPEVVTGTDGPVPLTEARGKLSSRTYIENVPEAVWGLLSGPGYLDELHVRAVEQAVPQARITTCTDYFRAYPTVVGDITRIALATVPEQFNRVVTGDGSVDKRDARYIARRDGVLTLRDDPRAPEAAAMMPNTVTIMTNFIIEALRTEQEVQYHLSGPDMINYATKPDFMAALNGLYQQVRRNTAFAPRLPADLTVRMVKATPAKFATTVGNRQQELEDIFAHLAEVTAVTAEKTVFFKTDLAADTALKTALLAVQSERQRAMETKIAEQLSSLPELLLQPGDQGMLTQYDVLREGGLYVPSINRTLSMKQLEGLAKRLATIRKRTQP